MRAGDGATQYNMGFYLQYLANWPEYYLLAEGPGGHCMGYSTFAPHCGGLFVPWVTEFETSDVGQRKPPDPPTPTLTRMRGCGVAVVMGKAEGLRENWHGHVTAVSVR